MKALWNKVLSDYSTQEIWKLPRNNKKLYFIVLSWSIKNDKISSTVEEIINHINTVDNDIDEIILNLYSDKSLVEGPWDIGQVVWAPNWKLGNITPEIASTNNRNSYAISYDIRDNLEEYLKQKDKSEDKFGLSEKSRRQYFIEIINADTRSSDEAEIKYPTVWFETDTIKKNMPLNIELRRKLYEKYIWEIQSKYQINKEQGLEIQAEAFKESRPSK